MENVNSNRKKRRDYIIALRSKNDIVKLYLEGCSFEEIAELTGFDLQIVTEILEPYKNTTRSQKELELLYILKQIFPNYDIQDNVYMEGFYIDILIEDLKLAIEYDGEFHFGVNRWIHGEGVSGIKKFEHLEDNDKQKESMLKSKGYYLIRISYKDDITLNNIRSLIDEHMDNIIYNLSKTA